MKMIDEKGRLFGKINIIDFIIILFLLFFIPMSYFAYRIYNKVISIQRTPEQYSEIEKYIRLVIAEPGILKLINVGDKEINSGGVTIGEIVWLGKSRPVQHRFDLGAGEIFLKEDPQLKEAMAKLKLKVVIKEGALFYKEKRIMNGQPIEFKTEKYTVEAFPDSEESLLKSVSLNINAILRDLDSDTVMQVLEGDKEIDKEGQVVAEVIKIGKIENSNYEINLGGGNITLAEDNNKKQIFVRMKLNCKISKNGKLYFNNQEVKYPDLFEFNTDKYSAKVLLTNILVNEKWAELKVRFTGVIPELVKALTEGDVESDPFGRIVGRLKVIVSNKASESSVISVEKNKFVTIPQPFYRDITVLLNLLCIEKEGILYFKNYPVKMGNIITFTTDNYSIQGLIVGL